MQVMVRHTVKPERVAEDERYIEQVFAELARTAPPSMQYSAFKLDDGVTFMHVYAHESPGGSDALRALPAFQAFGTGLEERCAVAPMRTPMHAIATYR